MYTLTKRNAEVTGGQQERERDGGKAQKDTHVSVGTKRKTYTVLVLHRNFIEPIELHLQEVTTKERSIDLQEGHALTMPNKSSGAISPLDKITLNEKHSSIYGSTWVKIAYPYARYYSQVYRKDFAYPTQNLSHVYMSDFVSGTQDCALIYGKNIV